MTRTDEVLALLKRGGKAGVTTSEMLAHTSHRYSAYILRLRKAGYVISSTKERPGAWRYTLIREPDQGEPAPPPKVFDGPAPQPGEGQEVLFELAPHGNRFAA